MLRFWENRKNKVKRIGGEATSRGISGGQQAPAIKTVAVASLDPTSPIEVAGKQLITGGVMKLITTIGSTPR